MLPDSWAVVKWPIQDHDDVAPTSPSFRASNIIAGFSADTVLSRSRRQAMAFIVPTSKQAIQQY
jgi:hypothetical protein